MFPFAVRVTAAGFLMVLAGWLGKPPFELAAAISGFILVYSGAAYWRESQRGHNALVRMVIACCDSLVIAATLASFRVTGELGVLVLVPQVINWKTQGDVQRTPYILAAIAVPTFAGLLTEGQISNQTWVQAAIVLAWAWLLPMRPAPVDHVTALPMSLVEQDNDAVLILRENFRRTKDLLRETERKNRADHNAAQLLQCKFPNGEDFHGKLSQKILELTGADSVALYTLAQFNDRMVVKASSGSLAPEVKESSFEINNGFNTRQITDSVELAARAMLHDEQRAKLGTVLLNHRGKLMAMVNVFHSEWEALSECKRSCEELAPLLAALIADEAVRSATNRRLQELELVYETAVVSTGATDRSELAERITRRLPHIIQADFVGTYFVQESEAHLACGIGPEIDVLSAMSFGAGQGIQGWLKSGAPDIVAFNPSTDDRCDYDLLLRRRIGSFLVVPLQYSEAPFGFIVAVSKVCGGLDTQDLASLRSIAAEFSQATSRIEQPTQTCFGLVSTAAFQNLVSAAQPGCLVYFEMLKRQQMQENCSPNSLDEALRSFSFKVRGKLSSGGAACRRPQGDFMVFLPHVSEEFARMWANDLSATASLIGVPTRGGRTQVPLGFRARVAPLGRLQTDEVFAEQIA